MAYRKAKGLCFKCGVKWNPNHKCAPTVSLHVVEELWQLIQESGVELPSYFDSDSSEDLCALSLAAFNGTEAPKTIRFAGKVMNIEAIILADSGSSGNFISESMASKLPNWTELPAPVHVRVANGSILTCTHELRNYQIWINGHCFTISLKIFPLKCYDIILGMDWLEMHSPMVVHWKLKWLSFTHCGTKVTLQGILPNQMECQLISSEELDSLQRKDELWCILQLYMTNSEESDTQ